MVQTLLEGLTVELEARCGQESSHEKRKKDKFLGDVVGTISWTLNDKMGRRLCVQEEIGGVCC